MICEVQFSENELKFIIENEICRIATSKNNRPHVVPVCYVYIDECFFFATDYSTKKYNDLTENNRIAIIIDTYDKHNGNKAVAVDGISRFIHDGQEFEKIYDIFNDRFEWVKKEPWMVGEAPFVKIIPIKKISWGLN